MTNKPAAPFAWVYDTGLIAPIPAEYFSYGPNRPDERSSWKPLYGAPSTPAAPSILWGHIQQRADGTFYRIGTSTGVALEPQPAAPSDENGGWQLSPAYLKQVKAKMVEYPETDIEVIEDVLLAAGQPTAPIELPPEPHIYKDGQWCDRPSVDEAAYAELRQAAIALQQRCAELELAVRDAFEHGVCVKARYTTRGDNWRVKHKRVIDLAVHESGERHD